MVGNIYKIKNKSNLAIEIAAQNCLSFEKTKELLFFHNS
jgi:hypothetical protein